MIPFSCSCGKALMAEDQNAGQPIQCPECGQQVTIPSGGGSVPSLEAVTPQAPPPFQSPREPVAGPADWGDAAPSRQRLDQPLPTSSMALTSFILGMVSFCLPLVLSIPAILFSIFGWMKTAKGKSKGRVFAIIGLILGILTMIEGIGIGILLYLIVPEARAADVSSNNLKQMAVAIHEYHDVRKRLPSHAIYRGVSWRVAILPYLGEWELYSRFNMNEPWDGPNNKQLLEQMPRVYAHPAATAESIQQGLTHYQVFVSSPQDKPRSMFPKAPSRLKFTDIKDGLSNTIMIVEAADPVPWTKPEDIDFSPTSPILSKVGGHYKFIKGFQAVFADGSVRHFQFDQIQEQTLRAAITANGGEPLTLP
jgi:hypothetical protein